MPGPLLGVVVSGTLLVLSVLLFRIEDVRGTRVLESVRKRLDTLAILAGRYTKRWTRFLERDLFRQTLHFFFHTVLTSAINWLEACVAYIRRVRRTNRSIAERSREDRIGRNMFDEIAEHKEAVALTPRERKKAKEAAIGERL